VRPSVGLPSFEAAHASDDAVLQAKRHCAPDARHLRDVMSAGFRTRIFAMRYRAPPQQADPRAALLRGVFDPDVVWHACRGAR